MKVFQVEANTLIQKEVVELIKKLPIKETVEITRVS